MHEDIDKIHGKVDKLLYLIMAGMGAVLLTLLTYFIK
jgi:hypothetical protein